MPSKRLLTVCAASAVMAVGAGWVREFLLRWHAERRRVDARTGGEHPVGVDASDLRGCLDALDEPVPGRGGESPPRSKPGGTSPPIPSLFPCQLTVPAGWKSEEPGPYVVFLSTADGVGNDGPATLALLLSPLEFSDPCTTDGPGTSVASVDDFVKAVAAMRGANVTRPEDVTVGGLKGTQVTLSAPAKSVSCSGNGVVMTLALGHQFLLNPGETMSLTALDDSGVLLIVEEKTTPEATAQDRAQIAKVLQSMSIG